MESNPPSIYALAWIEKFHKKKAELDKFRQKLLELAKQLTIVLKQEYHATEVYLIGSIASERPISFNLDLIPFESAEETIQKRAIDEGILL